MEASRLDFSFSDEPDTDHKGVAIKPWYAIGRAVFEETWALNNKTLPSVEESNCVAVAGVRGSPSVAMPSVMLIISGG